MTWALFQAITLLTQLGLTDLPRVELVTQAPVAHRGRLTQAYVRWSEGDQTIYVVETSRIYQTALRGEIRPLVGLLAHERWHLQHGPGERPAYEEQLRVLRLLKAPRVWMDRAQQARDREPR